MEIDKSYKAGSMFSEMFRWKRSLADLADSGIDLWILSQAISRNERLSKAQHSSKTTENTLAIIWFSSNKDQTIGLLEIYSGRKTTELWVGLNHRMARQEYERIMKKAGILK